MFKRFFLRERNIMIAIMLNAVVIFLMYFPQLNGNLVLEGVDHFFLLIFLVEAIVKLVVWKPKKYFSSNWNIFDLAIVVVSLPSLLIYFIEIPNTSVILILRLFRLGRLIRFLQFIPDIGEVLSGLGRAIRASVFVFMALVFMNFMFALLTCHFYGNLAPEYFGDPFTSSYTIFQLFTIEGWDAISAAVSEKVDNHILVGISRAYFMLVVLLGGIFGMSLANAVFVDEMTMDNNRVLEEKIDQLQEQINTLQKTLERTTE